MQNEDILPSNPRLQQPESWDRTQISNNRAIAVTDTEVLSHEQTHDDTLRLEPTKDPAEEEIDLDFSPDNARDIAMFNAEFNKPKEAPKLESDRGIFTEPVGRANEGASKADSGVDSLGQLEAKSSNEDSFDKMCAKVRLGRRTPSLRLEHKELLTIAEDLAQLEAQLNATCI